MTLDLRVVLLVPKDAAALLAGVGEELLQVELVAAEVVAEEPEELPPEGVAHEAVDEEVDAAVQGHEEVGHRGRDQGPQGHPVAVHLDAEPQALQG